MKSTIAPRKPPSPRRRLSCLTFFYNLTNMNVEPQNQPFQTDGSFQPRSRGLELDRSEFGYLADSSALVGQPHLLRQKLEEDPAHPRIIVTELGVGYRFREVEA